MARTKGVGQVKTVDIARGLFIIRYVSADDEFSPPVAAFELDAAAARNAEFLLHPDADGPVLWQPGSCLILRATRPTTLHVEVSPRRPAGSTAANIKIEPLAQGTAADPPAAIHDLPSEIDTSGLKLLGHVARIGDVAVNANEWLAGPSAPSRIEGIGIEWPDRPADLDIRYSVKFGRPQVAPTPMMEIGSFAGTRGRAIPLTSVVLELSGAACGDHRLSAEAAFLGSPTMRVAGKRVVLSGPTGREPLVGLRIDLEQMNGEPRAGDHHRPNGHFRADEDDRPNGGHGSDGERRSNGGPDPSFGKQRFAPPPAPSSAASARPAANPAAHTSDARKKVQVFHSRPREP